MGEAESQTTSADEWLMAARRGDYRENQESTPPHSEEVRLCWVWLTEAYAPAQARQLRDGLAEMGFAEGLRASMGQGPLDRLESGRNSLYGGSYTPLGWIHRPQEASVLTAARQPLPAGVGSVWGAIDQVIPSVTVVSFLFYFDDDSALEPDRILRRSYVSQVEPMARGQRFFSPYFLKEQAIAEFRSGLRERLGRWVAARVPGAFLDGSVEGPMPVAELWSVKDAVPFSREVDHYKSYMNALGLAQGLPWQCEEYPGLSLYEDTFVSRADRRLILAGRDSDLTRESVPGSRETILNNLTDFDRHLARWSLAALTQAYTERVVSLRDESVDLHSRNPADLLPSIRRLEAETVRLARTIPGLTREISTVFRSPIGRSEIQQWTRTFSPTSPHDDLREVLVQTLVARAEMLQAAEREVRDGLGLAASVATAAATIEAARSNARIQARIEVVSWIMAGIALLSLVAAILSSRSR